MGCCYSKLEKNTSSLLSSPLLDVHLSEPPSSLSSQSLPPIVFFDHDDLKELNRFPRSPEDKALQTKYTDIDRGNSLLIFVSHSWLRGWPGADGYDRRPHPDTKNDDKMKLILEAVEQIKKGVTSGIEKIYLWLDYGCIDQDASACLELKMLDKIVGVCDLILTPIYDPATSFDWYDDVVRVGIRNWYEQYGSPAWNEGPHAYINRSWCRVEMFYAANVPLTQNNENRLSKFKAALLSSVKEGRRPHVLFGSMQQIRNMAPIFLPPLQNSWFTLYDPTKGNLTKESDRVEVKRLVDELKPFMSFVKESYEGEYKDGKMHGNGIYRYASGDVYEGEWKDGKKHGRGMCRYASGNVYEGEYKDGKMHGRGMYRYASGNVYEGEYKDDKRHGRGMYRYAHGDVYEGEYKDDKRHGEGVLKRSDGSVIHGGQWRDGVPIASA